MAGRPAKRPSARPQAVDTHVDSFESADRATTTLAQQLVRVSGGPRARVTIDLAVGDNTVNHGLGVRPRGCSLTPSVADATFAWAIGRRDDRQATITVVGVAQPGAELEFWS